MPASSGYLAFNRLSVASSAGRRDQWSVSNITSGPPPAPSFGTTDTSYATLINGFASTTPSSSFDVLGSGFVAAPAIGKSWAVRGLDAVLAVAGPQALSASSWVGGPLITVVASAAALSATLADSQWGVVKNVELLVQPDQVRDAISVAGFSDTRIRIESDSTPVLAPEVESVIADYAALRDQAIADGDEYLPDFFQGLIEYFSTEAGSFIEKPITVVVEHAKRGEIDGADSLRSLDITLSLFSNGRDGDNGFHIATGSGDDTVTLTVDDFAGSWAGARDGRHSLVTATLGAGKDVFDASTTRAETIVRGGADTGWVEFIGPDSYRPYFDPEPLPVSDFFGGEDGNPTIPEIENGAAFSFADLNRFEAGDTLASRFLVFNVTYDGQGEPDPSEGVVVELSFQGSVIGTFETARNLGFPSRYEGDLTGVSTPIFDSFRIIDVPADTRINLFSTYAVSYTGVDEAVGFQPIRFTPFPGVPQFGGGYDQLIAGQGRDTFIYAVGTDGADLIQGFAKGQDRVVLENADPDEIFILELAGDTIILPSANIQVVTGSESLINSSTQQGIVVEGVTGLVVGIDILLA